MSVSPSTIAALWYLEVGGASGCLTALQGGGGGRYGGMGQRRIEGHSERRREERERGRMSACRK